MKFNKWTLGLTAIAALFVSGLSAFAQTATNTATLTGTNAMPPFTIPVTAGQLGASIPAGVQQVAIDGYNVFKGFSLTNPISVAFIGLKNGSHYGGGVEAHQVLPGSPVSAGFGVFAVQTETAATATTKASTKFNFYDATINLGVTQVENIPVLNIPITVRLFSGPFASLNGGVLMGEQSGVTGSMAFAVGSSGKWFIHLGGGVVNCAGAAAEGLKPAMPIADIGFIGTF